MAILSARPQAEDLAGWSYDPSILHPEQDADIPVLLVQGDAVPAGSARITISVAPVSTKVRLRSIDPSTTPYTDLGPAPANMFAAISGTTGAAGTPTAGQWSTDIKTTASHGLTIAGNYETAPGVWTGWTTNWKIIIISAAPVSTNGANPSGFLVYYTNAVDAAGQPETHTPFTTPPVANWPLLYAQRVAADMEDARTTYMTPAWGFGSGVYALAYQDTRLGAGSGKYRTVILKLDDTAGLGGNAGVTVPKIRAADMGRRLDSLIYFDYTTLPGGTQGWPRIPNTARPNAFVDLTASHELMHAFQFRMEDMANPIEAWLAEACADWSACRAFVNNNWWIQTLDSFGIYFDIMEQDNHVLSLDDDTTVPSSVGYGKSVFFKYLTDFVAGGSPNIVYKIWQNRAPNIPGEVPTGQGDGTATIAIAHELTNRATTLVNVFQDFATKNWLRFGIDTSPYDDDTRDRWSGAAGDPVTKVEFPPNLRGRLSVPNSGPVSSLGNNLQHLTPNYWLISGAFAASGTLHITVSGSDAGLTLVPQAPLVWRVQATRIPPAGPQTIYNFAFTVHDAASSKFGGSVDLPAFGPSGSGGARAGLIISNVTYDPNGTTGAQNALQYDIWAEKK